jgi:hypothetical protein
LAKEQSWRIAWRARSLLGRTTDEDQEWAAALLTEFGPVLGDGSVAEVSPSALEPFL